MNPLVHRPASTGTSQVGALSGLRSRLVHRCGPTGGSPLAALSGLRWRLGWLILLVGLGLAWSQQAPVFAQAKRGQPPPPEQPAPVEETPAEEPEEEIDPLVYVGIAFAVLLVVGAIAAYVVQQGPKGKRVGGVRVTETQIDAYRKVKLLMTGQTSQVWEVAEVTSGRHFAVKLLLPEHARNPMHRRFLFHEAEVGKLLAHPNIIKIISLKRDAKDPYFVMEFFPSGSLKIRIMHKQHDFIREKAKDIIKQVATGLAFMNAKGWVHRDIKPDNILVNSAGDVRIIDFAIAQRIPTGLAKAFYRRTKSQGTRSYMSPEQIRGQALDGRADIYSFGVTCYEMVTGRPPFRGASNQDLLNKHFHEKPVSPQVHNPDVTDEFAALVLRMLAKKREDRPRDFHEVLMALRGIKVYKTQAVQKKAAGS